MTHQSPYANFNFRVEIDGMKSGFTEVGFPDASVDVVEYREGADTLTRKIPGLLHYGRLMLRRGVSESNELFDWWKHITQGKIDKRTIAIELLDPQQNVAKRWVVRGAWPARYLVSPLIAIDGEVVVTETLECVVDGFEVAA